MVLAGLISSMTAIAELEIQIDQDRPPTLPARKPRVFTDKVDLPTPPLALKMVSIRPFAFGCPAGSPGRCSKV